MPRPARPSRRGFSPAAAATEAEHEHQAEQADEDEGDARRGQPAAAHGLVGDQREGRVLRLGRDRGGAGTEQPFDARDVGVRRARRTALGGDREVAAVVGGEEEVRRALGEVGSPQARVLRGVITIASSPTSPL